MAQIWLVVGFRAVYNKVGVFRYDVERPGHFAAHVLNEVGLDMVGRLRIVAGTHQVGLGQPEIFAFSLQCGVGCCKMSREFARMNPEPEHQDEKYEKYPRRHYADYSHPAFESHGFTVVLGAHLVDVVYQLQFLVLLLIALAKGVLKHRIVVARSLEERFVVAGMFGCCDSHFEHLPAA